MPSSQAQPLETFNRDVNPSQQFVQAYPEFNNLIENEIISTKFAQHEKSAVRWKRVYTWLGRIALVCIFLVMLLLDYQLTLRSYYGTSVIFAVVGVAAAAIGLVAQLVLIFASVRERWLIERFAAERLRCLKFRTFILIGKASNATALNTLVEVFSREQAAHLDQELLGGRSALLEFAPMHFSVSELTATCNPAREIVERAHAIYDRLRLEVQLQHFEGRLALHQERARSPAALSEFAFASGAFLALIGIFVTGWSVTPISVGAHSIPDSWQAWLYFLTWCGFVISAVVSVYQRGSGDRPNAERYARYAREVRRLRQHSEHAELNQFLETVAEMEFIALEELRDFCRDAAHSNYIF